MKIGLTIPTLNNWPGLLQALNSLRSSYPIEFCLVDNSYMNLSVAQSWNLGLACLFHRGCDCVLVCNDDILFSPLTIDALATRLLKEDVVLVSGWNLKGQIPPEEIFNVVKSSQDSEPENPDFSCFMVSPQCWEEIGAFDENFSPAYGEDNDYHARIALAGKKAILATAAPYYHFVSVTQQIAQEEGKPLPLSSAASMQYFKAKWGVFPVDNTDEMRKVYYKRPFNDPRYSLKDWPTQSSIDSLRDVLK